MEVGVKRGKATHIQGSVRIEVQRSYHPIEYLRVIRTHDSRSRRRAMPGVRIAVIDNHRACTCVIQPPSQLHQSERTIRARISS